LNKRILILSTSNLTTGALFHVNQTLKSIDSIKNIKTYLHCNRYTEINQKNNLEIKKVLFSQSRLMNFLYIFLYIPLFTFLKRIDITYCPWGLAPLFFRGKLIVGAHNPIFLLKKRSFYFDSLFYFLHKNSLKRADVIKVPSKSYAHFLSKLLSIPSRRFSIIHHGVDLKLWRNLINRSRETNKKYFIFWSWFHETKGIECMLYGFAKYYLKDIHSNYKLVLAGRFSNETYRDKIYDMTKSLGINNSVSFLIQPSLPKLISSIKNSSGIILPFKYETFGFPYIESRLFDKPIAVYKNLVSDEITEGQCFTFNSPAKFEIVKAFAYLTSFSRKKYSYKIGNEFHSKSEIRSLTSLFKRLLIER